MNHITKIFICMSFISPCFLPVFSDIPDGVTFKPIYDQSQHDFMEPTFVGGVPENPNMLIVIAREGIVYKLTKEDEDEMFDVNEWFRVPANIDTHWDGAWSVEFHPDFLNNHLFYILYRMENNETRSVIEEWTVDNAQLENPRKVRSIIEFRQNSIHSSGDMHFGPDGYLYSSQGDRNPSGNQPTAQDLTWLGGKMIRIDVDNKEDGKEYAIPDDNPFVGQANARPEIWALGLRVPYRFSFDELNGDIYLGDVGASIAEEINIIERGKNYGAVVVEGTCSGGNCGNFTDPVYSPSRNEIACVIGGFVYRADTSSEFYGVYIFADYQRSRLMGLRLNENKDGVTESKRLSSNVPGMISAMGQDANGNYYVATYHEFGPPSHIFKLSHEELKEKPEIVPAIRRFSKGSFLPSDYLTSGKYEMIGLDGKKLKAAQVSNGPGVLFLRDKKTGELFKKIRL